MTRERREKSKRTKTNKTNCSPRTAVFAIVHNDAEAFVKSDFLRQPASDEHQVTEQVGVFVASQRELHMTHVRSYSVVPPKTQTDRLLIMIT